VIVRTRAIVAWLLVVPCAAWAGLRLLGLERGFPLVPLVAFTPLVAAAALLVVLVAALLRQRAAAVVAAAIAVALVSVVAPRALGGPSEAEGGSGARLRVMTVNMRLGHGSPEELAALVRRTRPDVVSVQELTPALALALDREFDQLLPERRLMPLPGGHGIGLYARVPLSRRPVPGGLRNPMLAASLRMRGAGPVEVFAVHAPPPVRAVRVSQWREDLRRFPGATPDGDVRILAGDFNATLDHAELRRIVDSGYEDTADAVGAGLHGTWPSGRRRVPPVAIDHVLADRRCGVRAVSVHTIPGSDHRAVLAELALPRQSS
jgi:endonuclease/exonuclease/phosphatase (EEP) superfamily protein YafD